MVDHVTLGSMTSQAQRVFAQQPNKESHSNQFFLKQIQLNTFTIDPIINSFIWIKLLVYFEEKN